RDALWLAVERRRLADQRVEALAHFPERAVIEAAADAAGGDEATFSVVLPDDERTEGRSATAVARGEPPDHELVGPLALDLQPAVRAAPRLVDAVTTLRNQPLETEVHRGVVCRLAVHIEVLEVARVPRREEDALERLLAQP